MQNITLLISDKYYSKDPQSSDLGKNIVSAGIELLDELGHEQFTFKKLADKIHSTEASVYRYFDNKMKFLLYLTTWYWSYVDYLIDYNTHHISDVQHKLNETLKIICHVEVENTTINLPGINNVALRRVVMSEADKTYFNKQVDEINNQGLFRVFKGLCHKISLLIMEINPQYPYPHGLVTCLLETSHQQAFFAEHLPSLTEVSRDKEESISAQVYEFINSLVSKVLK